MIYISHRGNIKNVNTELENSPIYISEALGQGYHVEIDLWRVDNILYLGHDEPQYKIHQDFLNNKYFYVHCKNDDALLFMSKNIIWVHPSAPLLEDSICVLPEISRNSDLSLCYGICSDYIERYRNA